MSFGELIHKRRSVRGFTGREITDNEIAKLLEAATAAPNACNYQSWHFYVVRGRELVSGFVPAVYRGEWFNSAAAVFVVCTDAEKLAARFGARGTDLFAIQDTACAIDHLMLMAAELGLGSCFVGAFDEAECRRYLGIPEGRRPVALVPVGVPEADNPKRDRRPVSEVATFVGGDNVGDIAPKEKKPFTLRSASLPGSVFDDLNLSNSSFNNINMKGVSLTDINMSGATFGGMTMAGSTFGCVEINKSSFKNTDFSGVILEGCNLEGVTIKNGKTEGLTIDGCDISQLLKKPIKTQPE